MTLEMVWIRRLIGPYVAATLIVFLSALCAEGLYQITTTSRPAVVFLSSVILTAYLFGSGPAYWSAALSFMLFNFYVVEPRFQINYSGPDDIITISVFLLVAMLTGRLTGRIRDQARQAEARAQTASVLFEAAKEFSSTSDESALRAQLAERLHMATGRAAFVREKLGVVTCPSNPVVPPEVIRKAMTLERDSGDAAEGSHRVGEWTLRRLRADGETLGVAGWQRSTGNDDSLLIDLLADVGATGIARARLAVAKAEAETRARTEDLRNALLSSISHDLRTPLASILASASSLAEFGESFDPGTRKDLATTIQQEADRLDSFVANLLNMTRLEAGGLRIQRVAFSVPESIERVIGRSLSRMGRQLKTQIAPYLSEAFGDPILFEQALWNVLENAGRYTAPGSPILISAGVVADGIEISVVDTGPGIPEEDLERVFEKFYRSRPSSRQPGTGLGLSITRGLLEGMGGSVSARPRADGMEGLMMILKLPVVP